MKVRKVVSSFTLLIFASILYQMTGAEESTEGELVWVGDETQRTIEVGSSVELPCRVKIPTPTNILWVKVSDDGSEILSHDERLLTENPRFSIFYNSSEGTSLLKIVNVNTQDSGRYECQVPMLNTKINAAVEIFVVDDFNNTTSLNDDVRTSNISTHMPDEPLPAGGNFSTLSVFPISSFIIFCSLLNVILSV